MTSGRLSEYLSEDEPVRGRWEGTLPLPCGETPAEIGATDRRLVCLSEEGHFRDVDYDDIAAIETRPVERIVVRGNDYRLVVAAGALACALSLAGAVVVPSGFVALLLVLCSVAGLVVVEHGLRYRDVYDGFERVRAERTAVTVFARGADEHRFAVGTGGIDGELSRIVRGAR